MAEQRSLEINLISANGLQDVNMVTKMDVYAVVSISGDPNNNYQRAKTDVDRGCGPNPTWNFPAEFHVDESLVQADRLTLIVRLICARSLGDRDIGEVYIPVKELLGSAIAGTKFVSYQVLKPSGKAKGELNFSFRFGEKYTGKIAGGEPPPPSTVVVGYHETHGPPPIIAYGGYLSVSRVLPSAPPLPEPVSMRHVAYNGVRYPHPLQEYGYPPPPPQMSSIGYYDYYTPSGPPPPRYGYPPLPPHQHSTMSSLPPPGYGYPPPLPPQHSAMPSKNNFGLDWG